MLTANLDFLFVSAVAGLGAAALGLAAPLLRRRYKSRTLCTVWLALAVWLIFPLHIGLKAAPVQVAVPLPAPVVEAWSAPVISVPATLPTAENTTATPQAGPTPRLPTLPQLAMWSWLAGAALLALYKLTGYTLWRRRTFKWNTAPSPAVKLLSDHAAGLAGTHTLPVYENASLATAMLVGLWQPVLLVPQGFAANPQAALVLLHEYTHARRGDLARKFILQAAICLHWFNPAVWYLNHQAQQEIELACDEGVLAVAGADARAEYGHALLGAAAGRVPCLVSQFGGDKKELKMRLTNLFHAGKRRGGVVVATCLLAASLTGLLVACGVQSTADTDAAPAQPATAEATTTYINAAGTEPPPMPERIYDQDGSWYEQDADGSYIHMDKDGSPDGKPALEDMTFLYRSTGDSWTVIAPSKYSVNQPLSDFRLVVPLHAKAGQGVGFLSGDFQYNRPANKLVPGSCTYVSTVFNHLSSTTVLQFYLVPRDDPPL